MKRRRKKIEKYQSVSGLVTTFVVGLTLLLFSLTARAVINEGTPPGGNANLNSMASSANVNADTTPPTNVIDLTADQSLAATIKPPCGPLALIPTINAMSVYLNPPVVGADHATLRYRQTGVSIWTTGQNAVAINTGKLAGSLFWLNPSTSYDVETTSRDATGNPLTVNQCTTTTQPDILANTVANTYYVSASANPSGADGSSGHPYVTVQAAINIAQAGDQITVQAGIYHELLTFPRSGAAGAYIKIVGQPGAILDGADPTVEQSGLTWTLDGSHPSVYSAPLAGTAFATVSMTAGWRDGERFYRYASLTDLQTGTGRGAGSSAGTAPMAEGWFADDATHTLYVRSATNPNTHTWHFPGASAMGGRVTENYWWFEGLTLKYYNYGFYLPKAAQIVFRNNTFKTSQGIQVDNSGGITPADYRIEGNRFADAPVGDWPYAVVKGTNMETAAITFYQGHNLIIRDNRIEEYNNGIQPGGVGAGGVQDADVYRNVIRKISDDGLEVDGTGENVRVWGNAVDTVLTTLSLAPISVGPTWVIDNRFTQWSGRAYKIAGAVNTLVYHNTAWTTISGAGGTQEVAGAEATDRITWRNNIIRTADYSIYWGSLVPLMSMDYDNVFSTSVTPIYWAANYTTLAALCSAQGAECHGSQANPQLTDPANGVFGLAPGSPDIDTAVRLPGINDIFTGVGPDRGYVEQGGTEISW